VWAKSIIASRRGLARSWKAFAKTGVAVEVRTKKRMLELRKLSRLSFSASAQMAVASGICK